MRTDFAFRLTSRRSGILTGARARGQGRMRMRMGRWVLLGISREQHMARMLAVARRTAQGRGRVEFRKGKDADCFERGLFTVADVR